MPKQRVLPNIILGIMASSGSMVTGKQITEFVQRDLGEFWQVAHSQVYPELKRMTSDQWITCHPVPGNDKEKQYAMTEEGMKILDEWLSVPNEDTPQQKDIFSLKLFFIRNRNDKRIPVLLEGQIELVDKHLRHLEDRKNHLFSDKEAIRENFGRYLILNRAIARNRAQLNWLQDTLDDI
ncbi:PadR family transcriptional regulator [Streptococcus suis]|nr:PadR family transcriptional regulator [Streptococcus suis]WNF83971.1 PadR family transcriptional regulator [Streptococcus suis]